MAVKPSAPLALPSCRTWRQVLNKRQGDLAREPLVAPIKTHLTPELANHIFHYARTKPAMRGRLGGRPTQLDPAQVGGLARASDSVSQHSVKLALAEFLGLTPNCLPDTFFASGGHRRPTTPAFASRPTLSWVLLLAACDHASSPNELTCRRPHYGYTRDGARSARRSVLRPSVFEQRYVFRIPTHGRYYTPTDSYRLF